MLRILLVQSHRSSFATNARIKFFERAINQVSELKQSPSALGRVRVKIETILTGDNFVDGTDFTIADNNAANFVSAITP